MTERGAKAGEIYKSALYIASNLMQSQHGLASSSTGWSQETAQLEKPQNEERTSLFR